MVWSRSSGVSSATRPPGEVSSAGSGSCSASSRLICSSRSSSSAIVPMRRFLRSLSARKRSLKPILQRLDRLVQQHDLPPLLLRIDSLGLGHDVVAVRLER